MNKKTLNYLMYAVTSLIVIYYALNLTGYLVLSNNPTIANEPNIPQGSKSLSTNLINPQKGDFVCYNFNDEYLGNHIRVHRLIGVEGDKIEIKDGVVFVNSKNFDENLNLVHYYKFSKVNLEEIYGVTPDYAFSSLQKEDAINLKILIEDSNVLDLKFKTNRVIDNKEFVDLEIQTIYNKPWNKDNFGSILVPKNKIFVLGDNRDSTLDSRNIGFIDKEEIVSVIIKVF